MSENRPCREDESISRQVRGNQGIAHFEVVFCEVIVEVVDTKTGV